MALPSILICHSLIKFMYISLKNKQVSNSNMSNLNEESPPIPQPDKLNIVLMEHQKRAIFAMNKLESDGYIDIKKLLFYDNEEKDLRLETKIGILGDIVGSGKSLMVISLLLLDNKIHSRPFYYSSNKYINVTSLSDSHEYKKVNLLVIPEHLSVQWADFFKFAPSIKIKVIKKDNVNDNFENIDVLIILASAFEKFITQYQTTMWNRIIIDEADSIKLKDHILLANFIWLVTGTPNGIAVSSLKYLKSIFGNNISWITDMITVKNNNDYIQKALKLPTPNRITIKCLTPQELKIIEEFIPKPIAQMINAGNVEEAIKLLNCNVDTEDNIFKVISTNIQNCIYNKQLELESEKKKKYPKNTLIIKNEKVAKIEKSIKTLNSRLNAVKEKIKQSGQICPVCLGEIEGKRVIVDCCATTFCLDCLVVTSGGKNNCPYCIQEIGKKSIHVVSNTAKKSKTDEKEKLDVLLDIVNKNKKSKILVFANFSATFNKIKLVLECNKIKHDILSGSEKNMTMAINLFKKRELQVLMLNAKNFGAGLNLQEATDIIIYHRFTKEIEEQVIGRAQRIGRKNKLNVYYLIHQNETHTFDEQFNCEDVNYENFLLGK